MALQELLKTYASLRVVKVSPNFELTINDVTNGAFKQFFDHHFVADTLLTAGTIDKRNWQWAMLEYATSVHILDFMQALEVSRFDLPYRAARTYDGRVLVMALRRPATICVDAKQVTVTLGKMTVAPSMYIFKQVPGDDEFNKTKNRDMLLLFDGAFRTYGGTYKLVDVPMAQQEAWL